MILYEVWYHDEWRSTDTYQRQAILSSIDNTTTWLLTHKDHWYDNETPIDFIVDQAIDQKFKYMTVTQITIYDDGHVTFEQWHLE